VSIAVPPGWAGQLRDGGWDPRTVGLGDAHAPGLLVAPDVARWTDENSPMPGVFVAIGPEILGGGADPPRLPVHPSCRQDATRIVAHGGRPAQVRRWTSCPGGVSYSEVVFVARPGLGVYTQIKQVGARDRTDDVLAGLRIA